MNKTIRFCDLFAGIGGFRRGLENVNNYGVATCNWKQQKNSKIRESKVGECVKNAESIKSKKRRNYTCVYSNEYNKYASQVYKKHYGECDTRDIRTVDASEIPSHDLICAGFPCQSFSIAGRRKGFGDTRGTLFYEICRIAKFHRTPFLFLENVKGLLNHDGGQTFAVIIESLDELGYDCEWEVLNSKNFGVPQNRERVFIVGHLRKNSGRKVFPLGRENKVYVKRNEKRKAICQTLKRRYLDDWNGNHIVEEKTLKEITKGQSQGMRVYSDKGISVTLAGQAGGWGAQTGLYAVKPVLTPDRPIKRQNGRRMKNDGEPSFALTGQDKHGVMLNTRIRRLTPTECARLQGFPDDWCSEGLTTNQYFGNIDLCKGNVKLKIASEKSSTDNLVLVSCTTRDINDTSLLNFQSLLKKQSVIIVLKKMDMEQEKCVPSTTKTGEITMTLSTPKKNENELEIHSPNMDTKEVKITELNTGTLWSLFWEGDFNEEKLSIILTVIKPIIKNLIFIFATSKSITLSIDSLKELLLNSFIVVLSDLKTENITSISDSQQYKCFGNAVTTNVIQCIGNKLCPINT